jgi:hypothetical protein
MMRPDSLLSEGVALDLWICEERGAKRAVAQFEDAAPGAG